MKVTNEKVGNKIIRTTVVELPLYTCRKYQADDFDLSDMEESLLIDGLLFCLPRYRQLHTIDISRESDTPFKDFQEHIKKEYGDKYKCYWISCLDHSGEYYSVNENAFQHDGTFTVRNWDTSNVGFVAIPKDTKITPEYISNLLTDLANGSVYRYDIIDNENDETVETFYEFLYSTTPEQRKQDLEHAKKVYDIDLDKVELE